MNEYEKEIIERATYISRVTSPVLCMSVACIGLMTKNGRISHRQAEILNMALSLENWKARKRYVRRLKRMVFWERVTKLFER